MSSSLIFTNYVAETIDEIVERLQPSSIHVLVDVNTEAFVLPLLQSQSKAVAAASVIAICRVGQIAPNLEGTYLMDGIAAAIIGGTSPSGGRGKVFGTIIGVLILGVVSSALTFLKVTSTAQTAVKGMIILLAIVIDSLFNLVKKD